MKKVILIRGPSGSGKTTYVNTIRERFRGVEVVVCSADDFFVKDVATVGGGTYKEYQFDPMKLGEAHARCFGKFLDAINTDGDRVVVVDNTFIHFWEMKNYIKAANFADISVEVHEIRIRTIEELRECIRRNVHRVPADIVARMVLEFDEMDDAVVVPFKVAGRKA